MIPCIPCTSPHSLVLYVPKTYLGCGMFQCITKEASVSFPTLQATKLKLRREIETPESQGLNPQNLFSI